MRHKPERDMTTKQQPQAAVAELRKQLSSRLQMLDKRNISPPIEIVVGEYSFYPYRGFADMVQREDFGRLTASQLRRLLTIADEILAMRRPELFEAFVHDDGVIVIDKSQPHPEYSLDISYNRSRTRVKQVYPQVAYPPLVRQRRVRDIFVRNDTAHELTHHMDFWVDVQSAEGGVHYLHSGSTLLAWLQELDVVLHPKGVAALIMQVRSAEGYVAETLLEEGYSTRRVDEMLRAEFFAIAGECYYGSRQRFRRRSALLQCYMDEVLDVDLQLHRHYMSFEEMEKRRALLCEAIHAPVEDILAQDAAAFYRLRQRVDDAPDAASRREVVAELERLVVQAIVRLMRPLRKNLLQHRGGKK